MSLSWSRSSWICTCWHSYVSPGSWSPCVRLVVVSGPSHETAPGHEGGRRKRKIFNRPLLAVARHTGREPFTAADCCRGKGASRGSRDTCQFRFVPTCVNLTGRSGDQKAKQRHKSLRLLGPATVRGGQIHRLPFPSSERQRTGG